MKKDLTTSEIDRQNILNNPYALTEIEKAAGIQGIPFEGRTVVLKEQAAAFFEVTVRTVENYLEKNAEELKRNGYEVIVGKRLKAMKLEIQGLDDPETDFGIISKTARLGILDFRAFLNLAMLMTESHRAVLVRHLILNLVYVSNGIGSKRGTRSAEGRSGIETGVDSASDRAHVVRIKAAAPLLASVIRWLFFCPDAVVSGAGGTGGCS